LAFGCWLLAVGFLAVGFWLLAFGDWLFGGTYVMVYFEGKNIFAANSQQISR